MSNNRLTDSQRQFAADNHNLIYLFLNGNCLNENDYYDIVALGYLAAVQKYTEEPAMTRYRFSTIACRFMRQSVSNHTSYLSRGKRRASIISLDSLTSAHCDLRHGDIVYGEDHLMQRLEMDLLLRDLAAVLSAVQMVIIQLRIAGYSLREIARSLEMRMKDVSRLLEDLRETVKIVCYGQNEKRSDEYERKSEVDSSIARHTVVPTEGGQISGHHSSRRHDAHHTGAHNQADYREESGVRNQKLGVLCGALPAPGSVLAANDCQRIGGAPMENRYDENTNMAVVPTLKYYDGNGALVFVSSDISDGDKWMSMRQKTIRSGTHRVKSKQLPIRESKDAAQRDLDAYAKQKRWEEAV